MNETQMKENLDWALDAIDDGDLPTAIKHINLVRDNLITEQAEANKKENETTFYPDANDQHLIRQNLNRALGKK